MSESGSSKQKCYHHRDEDAGWRCDECNHVICFKCTARVLNHYYCCHCEKECEQLTISRRSRGFTYWLINAMSYPFRRLAPTLLAAIVVFGAGIVIEHLTPPGEAPDPTTLPGFLSFARVLVVLTFAVAAVDYSAYGEARGPDVVARFFLKLLGATAIVWLPGAAYYIFVVTPELDLATDPWLMLYGGLALVYLPMVLISIAAEFDYGQITNPVRIFEWLKEVWKSYLATLLVVAGLAAAIIKISVNDIRFVGEGYSDRFLSILIGLSLLGVASRMVGLLAYVHGDRFGWGVEEGYRDPILDAIPDGVLKNPPPELLAALEAAGASVGEGDGKPIRRKKPEKFSASEIIRSVTDDNFVRAIRLYTTREDGWSDEAFEDRDLLKIGHAAIRTGNLELATALLEKAVEMNGLACARALFALAKLHRDQLDDADTAGQLFERLIRDHGDADVAKQAARELESA